MSRSNVLLACVFSFLASALCPLFTTPIRDAAAGHANLVAYVGRMEAQYFPQGYTPDA